MFELFLILIALFGSGFVGLWDLKTSDVPDSVCIAMIAVGLILHTAEGFITGNFFMLTNSIIIGSLFLGFGLLMYFFGQWGGGDGELLVSIGILLPALSVNSLFPFPLTYFINMIIIGAIYSIVYVFVLSLRNQDIYRIFFSDLKGNILFKLSVPLSILLLLVSLFFNSFIFMFVSLMIALMLCVFVLFKFLKISENSFTKKISTKNIKEGDMIGEDIPRLNIYKKQIKGLTEKEINAIKRTKKYVLVRDGVRYCPVFFISLLFTILYGNIMNYFAVMFI